MSAVVSACRLVAAAEQRAHYANSVATRILVTLNREPQSLDTIVWAVDASQDHGRPLPGRPRRVRDARPARPPRCGWLAGWAADDAGEAER
jgi:hypothetical protein